MMERIAVSELGHTWLIDVDGTLVKHNGYKTDGVDTLLPGTIKFMSSIPQNDTIILLTSRDVCYKKETETFLKENGIRFDHIIYDLPYGERILINDNKPSGLKTALAMCLARNIGMEYYIEIDKDL